MKKKYRISIETDTPTTEAGIKFQAIGKDLKTLDACNLLLLKLGLSFFQKKTLTFSGGMNFGQGLSC